MRKLINGEIKTRFTKKKYFNEYSSDFNNQDFHSIFNNLEKDSSKKINNKNEKILRLLEEDIEELNEKCKNLSDKLYIKQQEFEKINKSSLKVYRSIIDIIDQIDEVKRYAQEANDDNLQKILELTYKQVDNHLRGIGIEEIECKNSILDPTLHKCVQVVEVKDKRNEEIIKVTKKGYLLQGEVIRYASVIIAK